MIGNVDLSSGLSLLLVLGLMSSFFILLIPRLARGGSDERLSGGRELARLIPWKKNKTLFKRSPLLKN